MPDSLFNKVAGHKPEACNFIKKETLAQVFSCEFCLILKNTFYHRTHLVVAYVIKSIFPSIYGHLSFDIIIIVLKESVSYCYYLYF